jgi:hypothetical protein
MRDLVNALKALGYHTHEAKKLAEKAVERIGEDAPISTLVKEALRKGGIPEEPDEPPQDDESAPQEPAEPSQAPAGAVVCGDGYEVVDMALDAPQEPGESHTGTSPRRRRVVVPIPRQPASAFHWGYFLLFGWWLGLILLPFRVLLMGVDALFFHETSKPATLRSLLGWW